MAASMEEKLGHTHFKQISLRELTDLFEKNKLNNTNIGLSAYLRMKRADSLYVGLFGGE